MATKPADSSSQATQQGENAVVAMPRPGPGPPEHQISASRNQVFKSGPLFISSKGIGWTSWKKRWFVLTRTSLVFFRSDPNAITQKGGEMNLTLGGIDLNNSASVDVKVDKKLLTVFFPDGGDGRAFTLKAETLDDLHEWKNALENALALAPGVNVSSEKNGDIEQSDETEGSADTPAANDKPPGKSMVIGRPILLALEDIDGSPSFLEKALRFIEGPGVTVEGILRQAADVEEVYRRVREYEQGKIEFTPDEDAHVIADCVKYILRELPSSPVPASCCTALLEAYRDRHNRLNAMRNAILETFPEPNRKLLQRILIMMLSIASHKAENRMSISAVAACMSPLLLRPLLAGECTLENTHMDVAGDGSFQLLQAAAAANHAQAIVITLLEEYKNIFGEGSIAPELFSDSDECESGSDDDDMYEEDDEEEEDEDESDYEGETEDDYEHSGSETCSSSSSDNRDSDSCDDKQSSSGRLSFSSSSKCSERDQKHQAKQRSPSAWPRPELKHANEKVNEDTTKQNEDDDSSTLHRDLPPGITSGNEKVKFSEMSANKNIGSSQARRFGRSSAKKNVSMESIDFHVDDDCEIERLEAEKAELENRIAEEANGNAKLLANLEKRRQSLHDRRVALEKEVTKLREQLQKERDLRAALEDGRSISHLPAAAGIDEKTKAEMEEIALEEKEYNNLKQRADELGVQLIHEREQNAALMHDRSIVSPETSSQKTISLSNKENATYNTSHHIEKSVKKEGHKVDGLHQNDGKNEASSLSNKNQNQANDASRNGSSKSSWFHNNLTSKEIPVQSGGSTASRMKSAKDDGGNSNTSTFSKLTTRLNFLKERRNQIASELENMDKGQLSSSSSSSSFLNSKAPEHLHSIQHKEAHSSSIKPGTPPAKDLDPGRKPAPHSTQQHLHRLKSEGGALSKDVEKGSR